ncbi:beta-lactamase family protein [bacterium]|nr:beta-lactamase family protein [bacterium]
MTEQTQVCDRTVDSGQTQDKETCFNPSELLKDFSNLIAGQRTPLNDDFGIDFGTTVGATDHCVSDNTEVTDFSPQGDRQPRSEDQKMFDAISQKLKELGLDNRFSGQLVISRDGKQVFNYAAGVADRENNVPITDQTKMRIASMGKMFTSLAIMQLVERGQLSLNSTLADFDTGFPDKELAAKINIRQLLTHQAGVGDSLNDKFDANRENLKSLDDYIRLFGSGERNERDTFKYSNYGYMLLGKIVEKVSGTNFANYVQENIFKPAGMNSTGLQPDAKISDLAKPYLNTDGKLDNVEKRHPLAPTPAGGAYSTAGDMERFIDAFRSGKLLRRGCVNLMTTPQVVSDAETGARYGFGLDINDTNGVRSYGHTGGFDGTLANTSFFPDSGLSYTLISNISDLPNIPGHLLPFIDKLIGERINRK